MLIGHPINGKDKTCKLLTHYQQRKAGNEMYSSTPNHLSVLLFMMVLESNPALCVITLETLRSNCSSRDVIEKLNSEPKSRYHSSLFSNDRALWTSQPSLMLMVLTRGGLMNQYWHFWTSLWPPPRPPSASPTRLKTVSVLYIHPTQSQCSPIDLSPAED